MKKMLVILLILFTKVLADSDEDKYVDLLSSEEKQQFLENVARRIFEEVDSKENVTGAQSGEVSDDQLKEHNEYVKSIIQEEQQSVMNEDDVNDQKSASASEEIEVLGLQPLGTEKTSSQEERVSNESGSNNITGEDVTDYAPIIKRSIKDDNASKIVQSDENSETLQKVSQNNITSEETNELEAENDKFLNENNASNAKVSSEKVLEAIELTTAGHEVDKSVSVRSNQTDDARNVSVKAIHESRRTNNDDGKLVENTTDINTTTSTAEGVKFTETKPDELTNVSSSKEEFTTLTYPFESSSLKGNTTLDGILFESTKELTKTENDSESLLKSKNDTTKDSENKVVAKITNSTHPSVNEKLTESVPETTESVTKTTESVTEATEPVPETTESVTKTTESVTEATEPVPETTEPVPKTTESVKEATTPVPETTESVTKTTESVTEATEPVPETTEPVPKTTESVTKTTESVTEATEPVPETTKPVPETTESVTKTTESVTEATETVPETTEPVPKTTESVKEATEPVPETTESVTEATEAVPRTTEPVSETTESVTKTTKPVTATTKSVTETTEFAPETETETEIVTTGAPTESTSALFTTHFFPVSEMNIIVEDFTSAPTPATTVKSTKLEPRTTTEIKEMAFSKQIILSEEETPAALKSDEEFIKPTTKKEIRPKVIVHKPVKYIVGPKAKKMAEATNDGAQIDKFFELEKAYYDNPLTQQKVGKQYHVFEIPVDQSPFTKVESPVADQPYYVPVYNYAPNHAYFNPQNRLGPNAEDLSAERDSFQSIFNDDDDDNNLDETETLSVKMEYDKIYENKRKKFGSEQYTYSQPTQNTKTQKSRGKVNPADYFDSDDYFGTVRKTIAKNSDLSKFSNSDEADHPAHSIGEGDLKDHVRAIRNMLFLQKSFGLIDKDEHGASVEQILRRHKEVAGKRSINNHIQKVGYLKKPNLKRELYAIDDLFKANIEKFIEQQALTRPTPRPYIDAERDEVVAFIRKVFKKHRAEKSRNNNKMDKKYLTDIKETVKTEPDQDDIPVNLNDDNVTKNPKLSVTKNEVVKVSVYLQVLKDMVALDNKALVQFDWLGTTVDIQAALQKLFELNALVANEEDVHPSDMEILKYVLFIHKLASEIIEANEVGAQLKKKLALPRNKKPGMLNERGLINRVWLHLRKEVPEVNKYEALKHLNSFLIAVEDGLYDLHDAIKNVANITKYKNQHWYQNLKDLYISTDEKHLLQLLLHVSAMRLFTLIEDSAKNGLEDDYIQYMKKNRQHSKRTLEEMMFIMEIFKEYNKYIE